MDHVRITRIFSFEAAHALTGYNGPCKNIHGHSYKLWVTVAGKVDTATGMLIDFGELKKIVNGAVVNWFDHSLILSSDDPHMNLFDDAGPENLIVMQRTPSSENLVVYFAKIIGEALPGKVQLHHLKLYETELSYTEWYREDNQQQAA